MIGLNCYNLIRNTCDGACQGMGLCPIAFNFMDGTNLPRNRWAMFKAGMKNIYGHWWFKVWIRFTPSGRKCAKQIKELVRQT